MPFAWGAAITAGAGLLGGFMQGNAASKANDKAIAEQRAAREEMRADLAPWTATGGQANTQTADLMGLNGQDAAAAALKTYQTSPGYQFQLDQGLRATDQGAAGRGLVRSGETLRAEQRYGAGLADSDFGTYYDRLFKLSQLGQSSAAKQGAASIQTGTNISGLDQTLGAQQASIYGTMTQGVGNTYNTYQNQSLYDARTKALTGPTTPQSNQTIGDPMTPSWSGQPSPY